MPKERKQRGRRKKKTEGDLQEPELEEPQVNTNIGYGELHTNIYANGDPGLDGDQSTEFFGLLDESEQSYFKTIDDAMIADEFSSVEERDVFVENVYKEAEGKELKLATSPLGSKVLEQLLARSKTDQIRQLFKTFQGHFPNLVRQRYASHVCEMLFAIAATLVETEMAHSTAPLEQDVDDEPHVSTENLFLYMFNELSPDLATLGADVYASHVARDVLLVLRGTLFTFEEAKAQSKRYHAQKKYSWARPSRSLSVPPSFGDALRKTIVSLSDLPAAQLRMTASQPYSVSFVQVLVALEAQVSNTSTQTILFTLLGGEEFSERDDYIESILREPSGSKLIETIVDSVPATHFDKLYQVYFAGRTAKFARNPITNFVLQRLITNVNYPTMINEISSELAPAFKDLIEINHIQIIQKLVEASVRTGCAPQHLFRQVQDAFGTSPDSDVTELVSSILNTPTATSGDGTARPPRRHLDSTPAKSYNMQGAFLIRALIQLPEDCFHTVVESVVETAPDDLLSYAKSHAGLKVLESLFEDSRCTAYHRKRILNAFFGHFVELACDVVASRFVDLCWSTTAQIKLYKDRIAQELVDKADEVRSNYYGRIVWRNWNMDLFKNKRGEWNYLIKQSQAKEAAMARLGHEKQPSMPPRALANGGMHSERAVLMRDEGAKKARKKLKRQTDVEDEVDDIFNKKKQRI